MAIGIICFGAVLGYVTYRMLIRTTANAAISDLTTVVGAVGGGLATALTDPGAELFGWYGIGLAVGFTIYGVGYRVLNGRQQFAETMGGVLASNRPYGQGDIR
jgi:hypothetical protein